MRAREAREIRGWILRILNYNYPESLSVEAIALTLSDLEYVVTPLAVGGYLDYLEEKGYIETRQVEVRDAGISRRVARLTAKGKDLLEGNIPEDPGIYVGAQP